MEARGGVSSVIAVLDLSGKVAKLCLQYSNEVKDAKDCINSLREQATELGHVTTTLQQLLHGPNGAALKTSQQLGGALNNGVAQLERVHEALRPKSARKALSRLGLRSLTWPFEKKETDRLVEDLRKTTQTISLALQIDQTERLLHVDRQIVLGQLRVAEGAYFDSQAQDHGSICLPNTRVELLQQIADWVKSRSSTTEPIFWLNGMAGTGKSTISRSVARYFSDSGHLGASFFFKKGEADRQSIAKFFTTLAADLARRKPHTGPAIMAALEADSSLVTKGATNQFEELLMKPLSGAHADDEPVLIVVDALDECERDEDVKLLIQLFSLCKKIKATCIKLFVTSRPDLPVRLGFCSIQGAYENLVLHEIPAPVVKQDISVFLQRELSDIRTEYNSLAEANETLEVDWPNQSDFDKLVEMSIPLFIVAATICRFIREIRIGTPILQLRKVLAQQGDEVSQLSKTYRPVLDNLIAGLSPKQEKLTLDEFRRVIGPIAILASPLSVAALSKLLKISKAVISGRLALLHSILSVPSSIDVPVRLLHLSFRDFLLDEDESGVSYHINEKDTHAILAEQCLTVLSSLKRDICDIDAPGTLRAGISVDQIDKCLPPEVQYACLYWPYHVEKAESKLVDGGGAHEFLKVHFLHWIEALSLLDRAWESLGLIKMFQARLNPFEDDNLSQLLHDAFRFVQKNLAIIDAAPLQLYCSLLLFAPSQSIVRLTFHDEIAWVSATVQAEPDWSPCVQTLEGHAFSYCVHDIVFSHDSTMMASISCDGTARFWRVTTGECIQVLRPSIPMPNGRDYFPTAFSHDLSLLLCGSESGESYVWQVSTGQLFRSLQGQERAIMSVAFSSNAALAGSVSLDGSVWIWNVEKGACVCRATHPDFESVAFSPDLELLAGVAYDTLRLLNIATGECADLRELTAYVRVGRPIDRSSVLLEFSRDAKLGLVLDDQSIIVWRNPTGECIQEFQGEELIDAAAFSSDSQFVCLASMDKRISIWSIATGQCLQTFQTFSGSVKSLKFSPESTLLASGAKSGAVCLWEIATSPGGEELKSPEEMGITTVDDFYSNLSPDSSLFAIRTEDDSLLICDLDTRKSVGTVPISGSQSTYAISHDSSRMAVIEKNEEQHKTVQLWHIGSEEFLWAVPIQNIGKLLQLEFSPENSLLAVVSTTCGEAQPTDSSEDALIQIFNAKNGQRMKRLTSYHGNAMFVSFSHDATLLASPAENNAIQIWDVTTGAKLRALEGHGGSVVQVIFFPEGVTMASSAKDYTLRLWDHKTGHCLHTLRLDDYWGKLRLSGDGAVLHSANGTVDLCSLGLFSVVASTKEPPNHNSLPLTSTTPGGYLVTSGFGLQQDETWITWNGKNWLWLPLEYRPQAIDLGPNKVVMLSQSGRVSVVQKE